MTRPETFSVTDKKSFIVLISVAGRLLQLLFTLFFGKRQSSTGNPEHPDFGANIFLRKGILYFSFCTIMHFVII